MTQDDFQKIQDAVCDIFVEVTEEKRDEIVGSLLFGEPNLLRNITYTGTANDFATHLLLRIRNYGGDDLMFSFVRALARQRTGGGKYTSIVRLLDKIQNVETPLPPVDVPAETTTPLRPASFDRPTSNARETDTPQPRAAVLPWAGVGLGVAGLAALAYAFRPAPPAPTAPSMSRIAALSHTKTDPNKGVTVPTGGSASARQAPKLPPQTTKPASFPAVAASEKSPSNRKLGSATEIRPGNATAPTEPKPILQTPLPVPSETPTEDNNKSETPPTNPPKGTAKPGILLIAKPVRPGLNRAPGILDKLPTVAEITRGDAIIAIYARFRADINTLPARRTKGILADVPFVGSDNALYTAVRDLRRRDVVDEIVAPGSRLRPADPIQNGEFALLLRRVLQKKLGRFAEPSPSVGRIVGSVLATAQAANDLTEKGLCPRERPAGWLNSATTRREFDEMLDRAAKL